MALISMMTTINPASSLAPMGKRMRFCLVMDIASEEIPAHRRNRPNPADDPPFTGFSVTAFQNAIINRAETGWMTFFREND